MIPRIHLRGPIARTLVRESAITWRRLLKRTRFIAVTGSGGKTMAVRCLANILARHDSVNASWDGRNTPGSVAKAILETRPSHRFAVMETGSVRKGAMAQHSAILQPDVAVILGVRATHLDVFETIEEVALEKWALTRDVKPDGLLVLNGDDVRVMTMVDRKRHRVVTFGQTAECDFRISEIESRWPTRLGFRLTHGRESVWVNTQLVGAHWTNAAASAIATAVCCGVSLYDASRALENLEAFPARMQPASLPSGAVMLRDEYSGSKDSFDVAVEVLRQARVTRRVLVVSDIDDSNMPTDERMQYLGGKASESADLAVFVGENSTLAAQAAVAAGMPEKLARAFEFPELAAAFLKQELTAGDLALLKGTDEARLTRIYFALLGSVSCQTRQCSKPTMCDLCDQLGFEPLIRLAPRRTPLKTTAAATGRR